MLQHLTVSDLKRDLQKVHAHHQSQRRVSEGRGILKLIIAAGPASKAMATTTYAYSPSSARLFPLNIVPPQPATIDSFLSTLWHVETARFRRLHQGKPLRRARPVTRFASDANNLSYGLSSKLGLWQLSQSHSPISYIRHSSISATFDGKNSINAPLEGFFIILIHLYYDGSRF